jgi:outer membrane protein TolC
LKAATARTEQAHWSYHPRADTNFDTAAGAGRLESSLPGQQVRPAKSQPICRRRLGQPTDFDFGFTQHTVDSAHLAERAQEMDINARQALAVLNVQASDLTSLKHQRLVHIAEETVRERGDTVSFAQQIKLGEEQVKTAQEALKLAKQRYKLGLGSIVRSRKRRWDSPGHRRD